MCVCVCRWLRTGRADKYTCGQHILCTYLYRIHCLSLADKMCGFIERLPLYLWAIEQSCAWIKRNSADSAPISLMNECVADTFEWKQPVGIRSSLRALMCWALWKISAGNTVVRSRRVCFVANRFMWRKFTRRKGKIASFPIKPLQYAIWRYKKCLAIRSKWKTLFYYYVHTQYTHASVNTNIITLKLWFSGYILIDFDDFVLSALE